MMITLGLALKAPRRHIIRTTARSHLCLMQ